MAAPAGILVGMPQLPNVALQEVNTMDPASRWPVCHLHPWEYYPLKEHPEWKIPFIIKRNSGTAAVKRLDTIIKTFKQHGAQFATFTEYTQHFNEVTHSSTVK